MDKPLENIPVPKLRPARPKPETPATNKRKNIETAKAQRCQRGNFNTKLLCVLCDLSITAEKQRASANLNVISRLKDS